MTGKFKRLLRTKGRDGVKDSTKRKSAWGVIWEKS